MAMFKVGDKVRIAKTSSYYGESSSNPKDTEGKVIKIDTSGDHIYRVIWDNNVENSYRESDLVSTLVQFKVGDMVIMKREPTEDEWADVGEIPVPKDLYEKSHKVHDITSKGYGIRLNTLSGKDGWYPSCCFELLPDSPSKKDRLIAEARVRYPIGTYFYSVESGTRAEAFEEYIYIEYEDKLCDDGWAVYSKGKWANKDAPAKSSYHKFNVGDKVIANSLADAEEYDVTCEGWTGYVYKVKGHEIEVGAALHKDNAPETYWVMAKCFDRSASAPSGRKFKVGDMVIANSKTKGRYAITILGWIGEVKENKQHGMISVYGKGLDSRSDVDEDCFDLYKEGSHILLTIKTSENGKEQHDDSERVIKVSHNDFKISRGDQIRGSRINGTASEVTVGDRHRHYEARPIRG